MKVMHRYDSAERQHYLFRHQYSFKLKPRLLYVGDLKRGKDWRENQHSHVFCEILFVETGKGFVTVNDSRREIKSGDIIIYNPGIQHFEESCETDPIMFKFMALDRLEITGLSRNHLLPPDCDFIYSTADYTELFLREFNHMIHEFERGEVFYTEIAESIARTLIMYIFRIINREEQDPTLFRNNKNYDLALTYIHENFRNEISLEDIAEHCFLNKYYLSHLFTRIQGMSIGKYILSLRIQEAKNRLVTTNDSIALIASSIGFIDTGHFCRTFKKETSCTPLQYRKKGITS